MVGESVRRRRMNRDVKWMPRKIESSRRMNGREEWMINTNEGGGSQ